MEIRPLKARDVAEFNRFHAVIDAAERFERPFASVWSLEEARVDFTDEDPGERVVGLVAVEGDEVVGSGAAFLSMQDNLHAAYVMPWVAPERRRQGIGSAVLSELIALSVRDRRTQIVMETAYPFERREDHPYRRFAEKHAFVLANTEIHRVRHLPTTDVDLDALILEAAPHHEGYRFEVFDGEIPDALLPSLCHTMNQLAADAPTGELFFEPEAVDPAVFRHREETARRQGRTFLNTLAIAGEDDVVGYNTLVIPSGDRPNVYQWGTLVRADHRGHRLGMAVKARGLKALQERLGPDRTRVVTGNAEQNRYMVSINERLGFVPYEVGPSFLLRTSPRT